MQYEQIEPGNRVPLPRPSIDTGMGLERMPASCRASIRTTTRTCFRPIDAVAHAIGRGPGRDDTASVPVIADHLRASSFLVADGVLPGNEGRGYVLRRIMRRAMRHAQLLGSREPIMWRLVPGPRT
jgi:alanyl-tRNA synthetase